MVKGDRLRGIGCSPPYINPNRYTRYVLTDFRDLITVKITHKYALRGIVSITSLCARQTRTLRIHTLQLIVPMPPTINRTNFSSLVSTALFPESNRSGALSLPAEPIERDINESFEPMSPRVERRPLGNRTPPTLWIAATQWCPLLDLNQHIPDSLTVSRRLRNR